MKTFMVWLSIIALTFFCYWFGSIQPLVGNLGIVIKSNVLLTTMWGSLTSVILLMPIVWILSAINKRKAK